MSSSRRALVLAVTIAFRADRWRSVAVLVLSAVGSLVGVLGAYWLKQIVDAASSGDSASAVSAAAGMGLTAGSALLAGAMTTRMLFPLRENTALYLDRRIVSLVGGIATVEHYERPTYLDRCEVLRREMPSLGFAGMHTAGVVALALRATTTSVLLITVSPWLLAVGLFAIPSMWAGGKAEQIRQAALDATADQARRGRHLFELATSPLAGKELRVFGVGDELVRRHDQDWAATDRSLDAAAARALGWTALGWLIFSAGYGAAMALIVGRAVAGRATVGDVVLGLALVAQINMQVGAAAETITSFVRMVRVAGRVLWLSDYATASQKARPDPLPAPDRLVDGIRLAGVGFRYPDTDVDILAGFDLFIPAGATVAVVGDNGAGKSTLVKLLCRFYEPTEGLITVDGRDLGRVDVAEWRKRLSAGFQDFTRFELAAGQTIGVGDLPHIDDGTAVAKALERAASADIMSALPAGLGTQLGPSFDSGVELSGGQWQKLAVARAMMRPAPLLLVLDEPTATLDAETEHKLFARYASMTSVAAVATGAITLLVSHRFSTVRMADLIVVLEHGRVAGVGSHDDLMASGGLYAELYELAARAYH